LALATAAAVPICLYSSKNSHARETHYTMSKVAGYKAVDEFVRSGMIVGVGSGSSSYFAVERIGQLVKSGKLSDIAIVPTSEDCKKHVAAMGLKIDPLASRQTIDLMIDSANEVDAKLNILKGDMGAMLREKMTALAAKTYVVAVEETKLTKQLGVTTPVAVEVIPYAYDYTQMNIKQLPAFKGCKPVLRRGSVTHHFPDGTNIAVTDNGNYIIDVYCPGTIKDVDAAINQLNALSGVVEHGILSPSAMGHALFAHNQTTADTDSQIIVVIGTKDGVRIVTNEPDKKVAIQAPQQQSQQSSGGVLGFLTGSGSSSSSSSSSTSSSTKEVEYKESLKHYDAPYWEDSAPRHSPLEFKSIANRGVE